ncbi:alpha-glucuronidase [Clostridium saccharoperbutylacetonicum]|uniref:Xylan alpha-1,2-glucuronidase n=1 Tax=Clostridium saccharoperbutylacetonicum N1-4(HMT) TaxID=931276 RepID=M1MQY3_9CLOT|nr:alpha-glucuronidase family glycosyl hydrolase [Clostridium saccharoperbutylacetonicum]AGF58588.1 alpha-glucuronidase AguA [Clostridium saccharoperbutylacetonicum N1-4(HMT)]NRT60634.1 alpha-glucuronidase [Clostridium saccharoperbutylacetonicum]NSB23948.1 alpha-glucuronidase [Clostridium saccharoperbutylacetonicum]NSB43324.1 alpha-glucuronidase [Clostridium saccharoperbutylacetonicum]
MIDKESKLYSCWLNHDGIKNSKYKEYLEEIYVSCKSEIIDSALSELKRALKGSDNDEKTQVIHENEKDVTGFKYISLVKKEDNSLVNDGYKIKYTVTDEKTECISVSARNDTGILYGVFALLRLFEQNKQLKGMEIIDNPKKDLRLINHWDNLDGTIERGFAGTSILFESNRNKEIMKEVMKEIGGITATSRALRKAFNDDYQVATDLDRINDYARMLSSVGINGAIINNTNVHEAETYLIDKKINIVKTISDIFNKWGIKTYLSINFAAPITLKDLETADPLDEEVKEWWKKKVQYVYSVIPNLGGFMVKADSEGRPGPFTYGRNHADGANMLGEALALYGGILIWRCFVYNCRQDWRDHSIDRAKAAYDCFEPLDGEFLDNVYLQIKNGPLDFQVREPISPLFGAMDKTNKLLELQITQEYTGQQKHVCYLIPLWKEALNIITYANGDSESNIAKRVGGINAIVNVGSDETWTGHFLAQANLYGYGRLAWNSELTSEEISEEWINITFGDNELVMKNVRKILLNSWRAYENYTAPLGIGWMVSPGHHYGPDVDGYEFSPWGTYHRADCKGIGIDRTLESGTGYAGQYNEPLRSKYNNLETCPDDLLLFFHHVPYTHVLKSGKTVIQHIYDTHFEGYKVVEEFISKWKELANIIDKTLYEQVLERLNIQLDSARDWRDQVNTYFYRMSGIEDEKGRTIY